MTQSQKPVQQELFYDKRFFIILNSLISSGEAAKLGSNSVLLYLILKCFSNYETSRTSIGFRRLSELSGIASFQTIQKALKRLEEHKLIERESKVSGERSVFKILDTIHVFDEKETVYANLHMPYQPLAIRENLNAIQKAVQTRFESPLPPHITININIATNNGDNGNITINNGSGVSIEAESALELLKTLTDNPFAREAVLAIEGRRKKE
jgi:hypothetical protein